MASDRVALFKEKYEAQAGVVHLAADEAEAAQALTEILREVKPSCLAMFELPEFAQAAMERYAEETGAELLCSPFASKDLPALLDRAQVGVNWAAFGIAETGTLVEQATDDSMRLVSSLPLVHVAFVRADDLVPTLEGAAQRIRESFEAHPHHCTLTFISGPSRTGDIEMRLTLGVHGPEASHVIVLL